MSAETLKEKILKTVRDLPINAGIEDAMERLYLLYKVEKGIQQAEGNQSMSHDEAKTRMRAWLD